MRAETKSAIRMLAMADASASPSLVAAIGALLDNDGRYSIRQAAERMGCSVRTLHAKVAAGEWALRKIAENRKRVFVMASDVEAVRASFAGGVGHG